MYLRFLPLILFFSSTANAGTPCEPCRFNVHPFKEGKCSVYGASSNRYERVSEQCLVYLNLTDAQPAVDKSKMWKSICPTPLEGKTLGFKLWLWQSPENDTNVAEVKSLFPSLFRNDSSLQPQVGGYECSPSPDICWDQVKIYFDDRPAEQERFCTKLHEIQVLSMQREQAAARVRLCQTAGGNENVTGLNETETQECSNVIGQVKSMSCDAVGDISGDAVLPNCTGGSGVSSVDAMSSLVIALASSVVMWLLRD